MSDLSPDSQPRVFDEEGAQPQAHPAATSVADGDAPTPNPSRLREGSETCRAAGEASRSGVGKMPPQRRPPRHNHWNREKMVAFLRELAASQSVAQAARSVGMSRQSAYKLRNALVGTPFSLAWEVALEAGLQQLAHAMLDRAVNGVEVPHYYHGELVGTSRQFDERLAIWIAGNPWKLGRHQVAREYSAEGWDYLLERIQTDTLDWHEGDSQPGRYWPIDDPQEVRQLEDAFMDRSWYVSQAVGEARRRERK